MKIDRFVVGIRFNEKMFRISSVGGLIIDEILSLRKKNKKIDDDYFSQISSSNGPEELSIGFVDDEKFNSLLITSDQIILKKKVKKGQESVSGSSPKVAVNSISPDWW